jgi:hypothetical protein
MPNKRDIETGQWTVFWKPLGIEIPKRQRFLKKYNPKRSDFAPLVKLGVARETVDRVYSHFAAYKDPLLFHKFCRFFRRDPETVQIWTETESREAAFQRLYNIFCRHELSALRPRFQELRLLSELNRKGEGRRYDIKYRGVGSLANISGQRFTRGLNRYDHRAKYEHVNSFTYDNAKIICIRKRGQGREVFKFIRLFRRDRRVEVQVAADSKAEHALIRKALITYFNSYVDSPQRTADFQNLRTFLANGESENFQLVSATYFQDDYRITVGPKFNQPVNITNFGPYRTQLSANVAERMVVGLRVSHKNLPGRPPVPLDLLTSSNSEIIGAILVTLRDRRLNSQDRTRIIRDFEKDFGLPLGLFISYDDLEEREIYRRLLQQTGKKSSEMELRSEQALEVFKNLVADGIVEPEWSTGDATLYCVNRDCQFAYMIQRHRRYCTSCGERLLPGQTIVHPTISEKDTARYLARKIESGGMTTNIFQKKLLSRNVSVVSITVEHSSVELIPVAGLLTPTQRELLRLRMPNALILTARDNVEEYVNEEIECSHLFEFVYRLQRGEFGPIAGLLTELAENRLSRLRISVRDIAQRYSDSTYYRERNREKKNLGAELFEAHTYLLFSYMLRNSVWLGASRRGSAVPDGISAFPIVLDGPLGCLLWDSKYSEGAVKLGTVAKNRNYIASSKKNKTIRENGGVGGFAFVGNVAAPKPFAKKYGRLGGPKKPKIVYLTSNQLMKIFEHFRRYEDDVLNVAACNRKFIESLAELFFDSSNGKKIITVSDEYLEELLRDNVAFYEVNRAPVISA